MDIAKEYINKGREFSFTVKDAGSEKITEAIFVSIDQGIIGKYIGIIGVKGNVSEAKIGLFIQHKLASVDSEDYVRRINESLDTNKLRAANKLEFESFMKECKDSFINSPFFKYTFITTTNPEMIQCAKDFINTDNAPEKLVTDVKNDTIKFAWGITKNSENQPFLTLVSLEPAVFLPPDSFILAIKK